MYRIVCINSIIKNNVATNKVTVWFCGGGMGGGGGGAGELCV